VDVSQGCGRDTPWTTALTTGKGLGMARARKSWREKLENPVAGLPKVVSVPDKWVKTMGGRQILVPTPMMVDEYVRTVPKGKLVTVGQIRRHLAGPFKADSTCPMTTGIFLRIISEAAEEDRHAGKKRVTPYWRVVKDDGSLNPKFPGGVDAHAEKLRREGHSIIAGVGRKVPKVADFEKSSI
jgi:alkylated DNA nucleotide flippase Atl1